MTRQRPPINYATDQAMLRLSASIRERRERRLTAYDFDPGLQQVVKIMRREALARLADGLDLPAGIRELMADATQWPPR